MAAVCVQQLARQYGGSVDFLRKFDMSSHMGWGKQPEPAGAENVVVEFDHGGRTYRTAVASVVITPYYWANQQRNMTSTEKDLISGQHILVDWSKIGVVRKVE
ncbi:hypothetical protein SAT01_16840 [Sinomonas atrocyanea]|nr:hypothetical protein SAT01_16840 [Sinomonas atrocyanea]GGG57525.1 hypothetical protein GCM10007172_05450 [Sinomonas atrocyanea]